MMALSIDAMRSGLLWSGQPDVSAELRASTQSTGQYTRLPPPKKRTSMLMYLLRIIYIYDIYIDVYIQILHTNIAYILYRAGT